MPRLGAVRHGGEWVPEEDIKRIWVRQGGQWIPIKRMAVRHQNSWVMGDRYLPHVPTVEMADVIDRGPLELPVLKVSEAVTGGRTDGYRVRLYSYDSSGSEGSKTLLNETLRLLTSGERADGFCEVSLLGATTTTENTKYSIEITPVHYYKPFLDPPVVHEGTGTAVFRWQTGTEAVYTLVADYDWGPLSDWAVPTTYFNMSASHAAAEGFPASNAWDSSGHSTRYETQAVGNVVMKSGTLEWIGDGWEINKVGSSFYRPSIYMDWKSPGTKRRLDSFQLTHRGMIGHLGFGTISRGETRYQLRKHHAFPEEQGGGVEEVVVRDASTFCTGDASGPKVYSSGTRVWNDLAIDSPGHPGGAPVGNVVIQFLNASYYGEFLGVHLARVAVTNIRVRVREWVVTGYKTVLVSPATSGSTW